jgi:hypothetical protein
MHQPQYRDLVSGTSHLPWTYLHTIKDYVDWQRISGHAGGAPYQFRRCCSSRLKLCAAGGWIPHQQPTDRDPASGSTGDPALPVSDEQRGLIKDCLRANSRASSVVFPPPPARRHGRLGLPHRMRCVT